MAKRVRSTRRTETTSEARGGAAKHSSSGRRPQRPAAATSSRRQPLSAAAAGTGQPDDDRQPDLTRHVVYVHGIGLQGGACAWKTNWDLALFGRAMGGETYPAYWADILHDDPEPADGTRASSAQSRDPTRDDFTAMLHSRFRAGTEDDGRRFGTRVIPAPEFIRSPLTKAFLERFVKDTAAYFYDAGFRKQMRGRLINVIKQLGKEPFVLVAHSQGTMIAYDVLSELATSCTVSNFVTLGSPLGIQEVQDRLRKLLAIGDRGLLPVPACIKQWDNFAARFDLVAADPTLSLEFATANDHNPIVRDHRIDNPYTWRLRDFNPHHSHGYLSHPDVRAVVYRAVGYDLTTRFVVARDVMEQCARFPTEDGGTAPRLPILIEVLEPDHAATGETEAARRDREKAADPRSATLAGRIDALERQLQALVRGNLTGKAATAAIAAARIQPLRKYVAAHLTPFEVETVASQPDVYSVYAVWRSSRKRKLLTRSHGPLAIDAARASYSADGRGITWAVLDTGCRSDHPHFRDESTVVKVFDCTTLDAEPPEITGRQADTDGHGTHVCGIIAGQGRTTEAQSRLVCGTAPRTRLIVYKVLDDQGAGEDAWIIKAIDHIFRMNQAHPGLRVHGVNLSLGGPFDATVYGCGYSPICKELRDLWRQGVVVCVAAGNEGKLSVTSAGEQRDLYAPLSIGDPANLDDCIAVGSVNADKPHLFGVSHFSSRGPTADGRFKPDVVAPGERILSCNADFDQGKRRRNGRQRRYREESGTSMACPHVSGLIAAFLSVRREYIGRPDEVKRILLENCNDLGRERYHQGAGMPNLMKMLMNT